ncbi:hypothetical protein ANCCAN_08249 [Ancylostoma caninum]|uniref:Uncharacterized protein n=1 Tax=Ancylostoma caninum TaxID=29170 RepID=A0A368GR34_ANCCA|nr:hypothetical protein ANCCAN_08249 [Ancylostoma caninum]
MQSKREPASCFVENDDASDQCRGGYGNDKYRIFGPTVAITKIPDGLRSLYDLVQDFKCLVFSPIGLHFICFHLISLQD